MPVPLGRTVQARGPRTSERLGAGRVGCPCVLHGCDECDAEERRDPKGLVKGRPSASGSSQPSTVGQRSPLSATETTYVTAMPVRSEQAVELVVAPGAQYVAEDPAPKSGAPVLRRPRWADGALVVAETWQAQGRAGPLAYRRESSPGPVARCAPARERTGDVCCRPGRVSSGGHGLRSTLPSENRLPPGDLGLWTTGI